MIYGIYSAWVQKMNIIFLSAIFLLLFLQPPGAYCCFNCSVKISVRNQIDLLYGESYKKPEYSVKSLRNIQDKYTEIINNNPDIPDIIDNNKKSLQLSSWDYG